MTYEEFVKGTKRLNKMNFSFEQGGMVFETFWNRIYTDGDYNWNYKEHRHSFYELHICMKGECSMIIDKEKLTLLPRTFLIISPKKPHKIDTVSRDFSKLVLGIKIEPKNKSCALALKLHKKVIREICQIHSNGQ